MDKSMMCDMKDCTNQKIILFMGRWICGDCYLKVSKKKQDEFWEDKE